MSNRTRTSTDQLASRERIARPTYGARVRDAERGRPTRDARRVTRRDRVRSAVPRDLQD